MKVSDSKIGVRLAGAFGVMVVLLVSVSFYSTKQISNSALLVEKMFRHPYTVGTATRDIETLIVEMHRAMKDVLLSQNDDELELAVAQVSRRQEKVLPLFRLVGERFLGDKSWVVAAETSFADWQPIRQEVINLTRGGKRAEAIAMARNKETPHVLALDTKVHALKEYADNKADEFYKNSKVTEEEVHSVMLQVAVGSVALALIVGILITRGITAPLRDLTGKAARIAKGDFTTRFEGVGRGDEIGDLITSFSEMQSNLGQQTREIAQGASTIASSISEISATTSQLASSSAETSTTIAEVSTTVEELRNTAQMSNEKAELTVREAERANKISKEGKDATEKAVAGMKNVSEEMDYIAESIMKLSEQTLNISEIISAVNDLTDQSNLLSVNASIEAAKAGEYGKGFAVVAQEVKSLAEQSKEATAQIKTILNEIQKATTASVMATERGNKSVQTGLSLVNAAGHNILELNNSVDEFSEAAIQIGASSRQQLAGLDQLVGAVISIKEATAQNVDGAKQLEGASVNLNELGKKLNTMTSIFKV